MGLGTTDVESGSRWTLGGLIPGPVGIWGSRIRSWEQLGFLGCLCSLKGLSASRKSIHFLSVP